MLTTTAQILAVAGLVAVAICCVLAILFEKKQRRMMELPRDEDFDGNLDYSVCADCGEHTPDLQATFDPYADIDGERVPVVLCVACYDQRCMDI